MSEKSRVERSARRIKANARAWVTYPGVKGFLCQIADISITGCRIIDRKLPVLPERISLTIIDADLAAECEVVWSTRFSAGLRFIERGTQADKVMLD